MTIRYEVINREHFDGVVGLFRAEGWTSYFRDLEITWQALTGAGVCTIIALDGEEVVGVGQMISDGFIQAFVPVLIVAADRRRRGIGKTLIEEAFARSGGQRVDVMSEDDAAEFYRSFRCSEFIGFRVYPESGEKVG